GTFEAVERVDGEFGWVQRNGAVEQAVLGEGEFVGVALRLQVVHGTGHGGVLVVRDVHGWMVCPWSACSVQQQPVGGSRPYGGVSIAQGGEGGTQGWGGSTRIRLAEDVVGGAGPGVALHAVAGEGPLVQEQGDRADRHRHRAVDDL